MNHSHIDFYLSQFSNYFTFSNRIPFTKENPGAKAAMLSGSPGIGKTTLATLVAKYLGYEVLR
jgi:replication factor C subunit 1